MGLFDKLTDAVKNFDYDGAIENKRASVERNAREQYRQKARNASDEALRHNLEKAREDGNYIMEEEIEREMGRRGIY